MSELKVNKVSPRSGNYVALNTVNQKNIIINGDMSIAQRGTSTASISSTGYYTVDRWNFVDSNLGTFTMSQDTDVPTGQGFAKSLKVDCTTADASPAGADYLFLQTKFEGQNLQYIKKGTSSAESLTLSFWVKSVKTGTYIVQIEDVDNSSRFISKSYTIDSASTWEKKTITFAGDTTGTLANDNSSSLELNFWLGAGTDRTSGTLQTSWGSYTASNVAVGQVNFADSTSNDFWITGVQLEAGTTASDFEFLPVDVNLQRCYRYYQFFTSGSSPTSNRICTATAYNTTLIDGTVFFKNTMRASPSLVITTGTDFYRAVGNNGGDSFNDMFVLETNQNATGLRNDSQFSGVTGYSYFINTNNASASLAFNAEL